MNAPDTIYAYSYDDEDTLGGWSDKRFLDTDIAYVRADLSAYELGKIIEAQKAEIARLHLVVSMYATHRRGCDAEQRISKGCTCGLNAALTGAEEPPVQKRAKGSYGAECNRASCKTVLATWKHRDMDRYYCSACGMWINENNSDCDPPLCGPVSGDAK